mgnify:CR=1 FL=1
MHVGRFTGNPFEEKPKVTAGGVTDGAASFVVLPPPRGSNPQVVGVAVHDDLSMTPVIKLRMEWNPLRPEMPLEGA